MGIGLRYVLEHVACWPAWLQGALVKRRLIFRLGGQVSHGLSSRWLQWGHDVVMVGGDSRPCACMYMCVYTCMHVCVETSEQLLWGDTSEGRATALLPTAQGVVSHCRALLLWNPLSDSSGLICLCMKEMDCYYDPQEITWRGPQYTPRKKTLNHLCSI